MLHLQDLTKYLNAKEKLSNLKNSFYSRKNNVRIPNLVSTSHAFPSPAEIPGLRSGVTESFEQPELFLLDEGLLLFLQVCCAVIEPLLHLLQGLTLVQQLLPVEVVEKIVFVYPEEKSTQYTA